MTPPFTREVSIVDLIHGVQVPDPYRWLEDGASQEVASWVEAQDAYARAWLDRLPQRARFERRLRAGLYQPDVSPFVRRREAHFSLRRSATEEKRILCVRNGRSGDDRPLFDPSKSTGRDVSLVSYYPSATGRYVALKLAEKNSDALVLHVLDVATAALLPERIAGVRHNDVVWDSDDSGFYYRVAPAEAALDREEVLRRAQVRHHVIGTKHETDRVVRPAAGSADLDESPALSPDGRWLWITADRGYAKNDVLFRKRESDDGWTTLVAAQDSIYELALGRDVTFLRTNEGAPRYRVVQVDPSHPARARWKEVVPERSDATLLDVRVLGDSLLLHWLKDATSRIELTSLDGKHLVDFDFGRIASVDAIVHSSDASEAYLKLSSFTRPPEIWRIDALKRSAELVGAVTSDETSPYVTEQLFFKSKDGTRIPMFLVRRRDIKPTGDVPTLLYGYGGFEQSLLPKFRPDILAWLDEGGAFAAPNLRGGGEYGETWHRAGMLDKKQNVFDDFVAAAEELIRLNWTRPERLAIKGQSNGGLLVAAALTQRPDLFRVALPRVPLTDMVRYTESGAGATWRSEYGSPSNREEFNVLYAYSPYHHVTAGVRYPSVLVSTSDTDDRVDPMHSRKFVAALQRATSGGPILQSIQRNAGHMGADRVAAWVSDEADNYAFAFAEMGCP